MDPKNDVSIIFNPCQQFLNTIHIIWLADTCRYGLPALLEQGDVLPGYSPLRLSVTLAFQPRKARVTDRCPSFKGSRWYVLGPFKKISGPRPPRWSKWSASVPFWIISDPRLPTCSKWCHFAQFRAQGCSDARNGQFSYHFK